VIDLDDIESRCRLTEPFLNEHGPQLFAANKVLTAMAA
jgi:hypothetical protein